jgi:hypothetical protein
MKRKLFKLLFGVILLTQCMFSSENQNNESKSKPLKVEKGAVKVGEEKSKRVEKNINEQIKERSILVKNPNKASNKNINMNIGKVEFYVK